MRTNRAIPGRAFPGHKDSVPPEAPPEGERRRGVPTPFVENTTRPRP